MTSPDPSGPARLTAVIVTYRSLRTLPDALAAARRCHEAGVMRTVVVDNASPDATRDFLAQHAQFAQVVLGAHNIGFGRGCNRGLAEVQTPYGVFYNPDAQLEPESVREIVRFMDEHPRCAIAGPAIHKDESTPEKPLFWHVGGLLTPGKLVRDAVGLHGSLRGRQMVRAGQEPFRTDWVSGAMLVGRTQMLRDLGAFDPRFFLYFEETDLCARSLHAGHETWCIPSATARHVGGTSAEEESHDRIKGCIASHFYQSRSYYLRKQFGSAAAWLAEAAEFVLEPAYTLLRAALGKEHGPIFRRWRYPLAKLPRMPEEIAPL